MVGQQASGRKPAEYAILTVVILVLVGIVAVVGFYQDEVKTYLRLQGWNLSPVTNATREFLAAANKGDSKAAERFVGESPLLTPVRKGDRLWGFAVADYGGPKELSLKQLAPTKEPELGQPSLVFLEGGAANILVKYPGKHEMDLKWDLRGGQWKVTVIAWRPAS